MSHRCMYAAGASQRRDTSAMAIPVAMVAQVTIKATKVVFILHGSGALVRTTGT